MMNKIFTILLGVLFVSGHAEDKLGRIERLFEQPLVNEDLGTSEFQAIYVMEDGYSFLTTNQVSGELANVGDEVTIKHPFKHFEKDRSVKVTHSPGRKKFGHRLGWAAPALLEVTSASTGEEVLPGALITLNGNLHFRVRCQGIPFDNWENGQKVLLVVNTYEGQTENPFEGLEFKEAYTYTLYNVDLNSLILGEVKPIYMAQE